MHNELTEIIDLMVMGNWQDAINEYKALNITPAEFSTLVNNINSRDLIEDLALLGFYARGRNND